VQKVLMTGFDAFDGERVNPALETVKTLDGYKDKGIQIVAKEVPTVFRASIKTLEEAIEAEKPDVVICVGQAGGRTHITPERVAINVDDARIPDNQGNQPIDEAIVKNGPVAYWSTLPIKRIVKNLRENGIPAEVSNTAGTFVCNHLFYGLMHYLQCNAPHVRGGFIHIPFLPEQTVNKLAPSMALETIAAGLKIAAITAALEPEDIKESGGAIH
jgi:pyroglutamyl-peptidase